MMDMDEPEVITVYQQKTDGTLATLIPKSIRDRMGIVKGNRFMVFSQDDKIIYKLIRDLVKKQ